MVWHISNYPVVTWFLEYRPHNPQPICCWWPGTYLARGHLPPSCKISILSCTIIPGKLMWIIYRNSSALLTDALGQSLNNAAVHQMTWRLLSTHASLYGHNFCNAMPLPSWNTLQWRHNVCDGVSSHQPHDYLLNRLFWRRSKKTSKPRGTGLCARNSPVTDKFPAQRTSNAENVSIWWRHHEYDASQLFDASTLTARSLAYSFIDSRRERLAGVSISW